MDELYSQTNYSDFSPRVIPYQSAVVDFLDEWLRSEENNELILASIIESRFK